MAVDADFDKVSLLLHFDGADASTTFVDSSGTPKTVTALGTAQISTAQSQFGGASFLSTGGGVTVPSSAGLDVSGGDFSIQMRVRPSSLAVAGILVNKASGSGSDYPYQAYVTTSGGIVFRSYSGASALFEITTSSGLLSASTWSAVELSRAGSTLRVFVDGAVVGTATYAGSLPSNIYPLSIGAYSNNAAPFAGHIDEFRFTKGLARNTSSYTPDSAAFLGGATYSLAGTVRDATNALAARKVVASREDTNALVGTTTSDATTGVYSIDTKVGTAHTLVFYPADGESLNALVLRGVLPIET